MATIDSSTNHTLNPVPHLEHGGWGRPLTGVRPGLLAGVMMAAILCFLAVVRHQEFYTPLLVIASTSSAPGPWPVASAPPRSAFFYTSW